MAGSDQSARLQGMLTQLAGDIGGMGAVQADYGNAIRNMARPDLDMDDPQSMSAYGQWLINNGKTAEGQQMMGQAADLKRQNRVREGESAIVGLLARLSPDTPQAEREKIITAVGRIAEATGASPAAYQQLMNEQNLARRGMLATEQDTASKIQSREDDTRLRGIKLRQDQQALDQQHDRWKQEFARGIFESDRGYNRAVYQDNRDYDRGVVTTDRAFAEEQYQYRDTANRLDTQFSARHNLDLDRFEEEQRMNDHGINVDNTKLEQGWAGLGLEERRVVVAEQLKDNEIDFTQFRKLVMGDENRRLNEMHPFEIEAKKAGIQVALASAGFTEAQTERLMYDLGFDKSTEEWRRDIIESQADLADVNVGIGEARIKLIEAQTDLAEEEIPKTRAEVDRIIQDTRNKQATKGFIEAQIDNLVATGNLNKEKWEYQKGRDRYLDAINEEMLSFNRRVDEAGLALTQANIDNIYSTITSRSFSDRMAAAAMLGNGISESRTAAFSLGFDPLNKDATDRARATFLREYGRGAAVDFDDALKEKLNIATLRLEAQKLQAGYEGAKPPTRKQLEDANFPDEAINVILNTNDAGTRNQLIIKEANRLLTKETGAVVTQKHIDVMKERAEELFYGTFGEDWYGPFPTSLTGNKVWDGEVIKAINWSMAAANAAGKTPEEITMAGVVAMMPWLNEVGGGSVENLDNYMRKAGLE